VQKTRLWFSLYEYARPTDFPYTAHNRPHTNQKGASLKAFRAIYARCALAQCAMKKIAMKRKIARSGKISGDSDFRAARFAQARGCAAA
jgi:hypothetical protein